MYFKYIVKVSTVPAPLQSTACISFIHRYLIRERILIGRAKIGVFAASIFYIQVKGADCNREQYFIWERTVMETVRYTNLLF